MTISKLIGATLAIALLSTVSYADPNTTPGGMQNPEVNRGRMGRHNRQMQRQGKRGGKHNFFMNLPGVKEEMEKHRENTQNIRKTQREKIKEVVKNAKDTAKDDKEFDRDAVKTEIDKIVTEGAKDFIDEKIRHQRELADLLEKNKAEAVEKVKEGIAKMRKGRHNGRRGGSRGRKGGRGMGANEEAPVEAGEF
jgi:3-oxoacyl-[acyl-carrier-protein] synthase III